MSKYSNQSSSKVAEMFKALSNPNRLNIFMRLASCCSPASVGSESEPEVETCACVGELGEKLGIAPSTVSHHIKELYRAGLILMKRNGQNVQCWVEPETLDKLAGFFSGARKG